jgi:hypothetical protein
MSVPEDPQENPQPDVDVTVGSTPLVGDAPPSEGTDVDVAVSPTTALERIRRGTNRHASLEGSVRERVGSSPPLPASAGIDSRAAGFHTAAARAAAHPGLQSEVESFGGPSAAAGLVMHPPGGP